MAIIYSYPTEANPALSDLLIGTDVGTKGNPTKSFTIGSIVGISILGFIIYKIAKSE